MNEYDSTPEWGYCTEPGCHEVAEPLWFSGGFPDDPDLLLCYQHAGAYVGKLYKALQSVKYICEQRAMPPSEAHKLLIEIAGAALATAAEEAR